MADITNWPWALNQALPEGYGYPAEALRAQHYAATSGGTGVDSPTALKVVASDAPDGQFHVLPGGGTAKSTYAGQNNQSYQGSFFRRESYDLAPTGSSSSGRHDLIVQRFIDPDHEDVPGYDGEYPIPPDVAVDMQFFWIEVLQGRSATTELPYPHVKLAHIRREPNTTIVRPEDIIDLRQLAAPKTDWHVESNNMTQAQRQNLGATRTVWPVAATHTALFPEWATRMNVIASWGQVRSGATASSQSDGIVQVRFTAPDGDVQTTEISRWTTPGENPLERFPISFSDRLGVRPNFRGQPIKVEFLGEKTDANDPNPRMDGASSWSIQIFFKQEIS